MASKVGTLIKKARTEADMTQEELARKVDLNASDISKAERGEKELTQAQLKRIAKATGVTQASLLNAAKGKSSGKTSASSKSSPKSTSKSSKTSSAKTSSVKLTAAEKKFVDAYREASAAERKAALRILQGKCAEFVEKINGGDEDGGELADFLGDALSALLGGH